jgi:hypothetical protein
VNGMTLGQMGQKKLYGFYCLPNGGDLNNSGTDGTSEIVCFVLLTEWW